MRNKRGKKATKRVSVCENEGRDFARQVFERALQSSLDVKRVKRLGDTERKISKVERFVVSI